MHSFSGVCTHSVVSALILANDGIRACAKMWCDGKICATLEIIEGSQKNVSLLQCLALTFIHVGDALFSTFNLMIIGYIVSKSHSHGFRNFFMNERLFNNIVSKTCFVNTFAEEKIIVLAEAIYIGSSYNSHVSSKLGSK
jgi:hypothetical protein